ncbi:MAG: FecR family protein [Opitutaceae bacterium]
MIRLTKSVPMDMEDLAADWIVRRDAGLTTAEQIEFERWLAADPRHAEAFAHHDETWAVLDHPRRAGHSGSMLHEFRARASRRLRRRVGVSAAALCALLVTGNLWQSRRTMVPVAIEATPIPVGAIVTTPEKRLLPDGSIAELKAGAQITVTYDGAFRRVALRHGEAHFEVAADVTRPFVVEAGGIEVRAVGTAFAVQLGHQEVEVLVTHGRVAIDRPVAAAPIGSGRNTASDTLATVDAGELVVVDVSPQPNARPVVTAVPATELRERLAWREPRLEFTDTPLPDAIAFMNRHSAGRQGVRFVIDDPALATMEVSGFFRADNGDTFVRMLEASFGVKAERAGNTITLRKAPAGSKPN